MGILVIYLTIGLAFEQTDGENFGEQVRVSGIYMFSLILAPTMKYMLFYAIVFYTYEV